MPTTTSCPSSALRHEVVTHATYYQNFPHLIDWFKEEANPRQVPESPEGEPSRARTPQEISTDLRRENTRLRRTVAIYAEALR
ncbi:hypothetical protein KV557_00505 [Kitasatospora aureofaciens]|uniref:hypothetical protein n=1 Tax=Kitasatospora aureofaciens TaxID=1894 RepID=UPI001C45A00C|nr:hypothetical protein [Kitasatospora aureofaciens]MBV6695606.1 hypothetical protein [Kitasatospora aureofaciens]